MITINTAFSTCPNDTFIFHAMVHGKVHTQQFLFKPFMADVEKLNNDAFLGIFELTKLSFHAFLHLKDRYMPLNSGSALGYGCGPLLVAKHKNQDIDNGVIAVPGMYTTALLLLKLWKPEVRVATLRFDEIMPSVRDGKYAAGLIIHEGRFVFGSYGLEKIIDLGEWWETETGLPIPLGCIALRKDKGEYFAAIDDIMKTSIEYAQAHPDESRDFIRKAAQEMDDDVIRRHIELYVNDYTRSIGEEGREAVAKLEAMARKVGVL
jgi:1,4-dihydroxy-6-naphthoate synthase